MTLFTKDELRDKMNRFRTTSLFVEFPVRGEVGQPLMTLREGDYTTEDGRILPSLRDIYMEHGDITEYTVAMHVLGDWEHWKRITSNAAIMTYISKWREELEVRLRSEAIRSIADVATGTSQSKLGAAKYIAEGGWKEKKAGRPTKKQVERAAKVEAQIANDVDEDLERIDLH